MLTDIRRTPPARRVTVETVVEAGAYDLGPEAIEGSVTLCSRSVNVRGRCRDVLRHRPSQVAEHLLRA